MISIPAHSARKGQANDGAALRCVSAGIPNARQTFTPSAARRPACPPLRGATFSPEAACVLALPLARASKGARAFHSQLGLATCARQRPRKSPVRRIGCLTGAPQLVGERGQREPHRPAPVTAGETARASDNLRRSTLPDQRDGTAGEIRAQGDRWTSNRGRSSDQNAVTVARELGVTGRRDGQPNSNASEQPQVGASKPCARIQLPRAGRAGHA